MSSHLLSGNNDDEGVILGDKMFFRKLRLWSARKEQQTAKSRQRETLVYSVAHDLQVPVIAGNRVIDLLLEGNIDPEMQRQLLIKLKHSNSDVLQMIQNVIYEYRRENGCESIKKQPLDLTAILIDCINQVSLLSKEKNLEMQISFGESEIKVNADAIALRRVFINLLHNAVKFTHEGLIRVEANVRHGMAEVKVTDSGLGIKRENQEKIFERFWQAETSRSLISGGIGLYLCRQLVESHGGTISCTSERGQGSTFTVCLPLEPSFNITSSLEKDSPALCPGTI